MFGSGDIFKVQVVFEAVDKLSKPLKQLEDVSEKTRKTLEKLYNTSDKLASIGKKLAIFGGGITSCFCFTYSFSYRVRKTNI